MKEEDKYKLKIYLKIAGWIILGVVFIGIDLLELVSKLHFYWSF
jgi:hypothetical protein